MFQDDRKMIENKYHKTDEPFHPHARMAYHGYEYDPDTGLEDEEIIEGLHRLYESNRHLPHPVAKAYAVKYVLDRTKIDVNEHDWFVGLWSVNRLANHATFYPWREAVFSERIPETQKLMDDMNRSGAVAIWPDFDHVVPDWNSIFTLGFSGLIQRAAFYKDDYRKKGLLTAEKGAFFDGIMIEYQAILDVIDRLWQYANTHCSEKSAKIAECLKQIHDGAPTNIYEAMQVIYLYFIISESFDTYQVRSLGNGLDHSLYRFYRNDLKNGTYTREEIKELLRYFLMQWSAIGNYWGQPFYLGGTECDGSTKYNELSYDILDVYDEIGIYNPKIQLKINRNTPDRLLNQAFDMVRRGHNSIVFCCEPGMMKAMMSYGATYEEALNMDIRGCYEMGVRSNEVVTGTGYINSVKSVLYVLSNGYDETLQKQFGLQTGEITELKTFDDFYYAVLLQWEHLIRLTMDAANQFEQYLGYINPSNLYSATIEDALKKGVDAYQCGVKFNNSAILNCGFASLVDSVMAVKEFVYDKQTVTLSELVRALQNNWEGYEELHTKIVKSPHKYGNCDEETDRYTEAMSAYFVSRVNHHPNARGGFYKAVMHSALQFVWQGEKTGATPDGRKTGEELSKNASPSVGMDKNGVTALIQSALKTNPDRYWESHCLDVMLHPSVTEGENGLNAMKHLLFTYLEHYGQSMQFNVFRLETLKDAQKHPEKYETLQVRVCGWCVLWNRLSEQEQNAYIKRAESIKF